MAIFITPGKPKTQLTNSNDYEINQTEEFRVFLKKPVTTFFRYEVPDGQGG